MSDYAIALTDLMNRKAAATADAQRQIAQLRAQSQQQSGQMWGQAIGALGNVVPNVMALRQQRTDQAAQQAQQQSALDTQALTRRNAQSEIDARDTDQQAQDASRQLASARSAVGGRLMAMRNMPDPVRTQAWAAFRATPEAQFIAKALGDPWPDTVPTKDDLNDGIESLFPEETATIPSVGLVHKRTGRTIAGEPVKPIDHDPTHDLVTPTGDMVRRGVPRPTATPNPTEASLAAAAAAGDQNAVKALALIKAQRPAPVGSSDPGDAEAIADAIIRGEQSPETTGLYRVGAEVRAVLAKKGYNQAQALTDWRATQKHVATLNGAQQTRLSQAVNQLPDLLDSVETLAGQWKGGRFPILNKVNLAAAKNGVYGKDVASAANQLSTQIADVTADLATVYMGGNSPTDHGLELAGTALKGEWDEKVLRDMVTLAKKNVVIRRNSILNTGVAGASAGNAYAPAAAPAPPPPASGGAPTYADYLKSRGGK